MDFHIVKMHKVKMHKDKEVNKNVKNIFLSMCDVKVSLTFTSPAETEYISTRSWYRNINLYIYRNI
jgi:tyrosyl-tRNA synthetase